MVNIAIIGSAGRGYDQFLVNKTAFLTAIENVFNIVEVRWKLDWNDITLVSGGSAFADHIAVKLYLVLKEEYPKLKLKLHLPCEWSTLSQSFEEPKCEPSTKTASALNVLHRKFSLSCELKSLNDIQKVIRPCIYGCRKNDCYRVS
jgi:hypothetical protein